MKLLAVPVLLGILVISLSQSKKATPIDLSYGYDNETVYFPNSSPFSWTDKKDEVSPEGVWYSSSVFKTGEHSGTHIDAPYHFKKDGTTVDKIPLHKFFTTGILINATVETGNNPLYQLPASKLIEWERVNGEIPNNSVVIVDFGWGRKFYADRKQFLGPADDDLKFPGLSLEAAEWIVNTKRVVGVGIDTASPELPGGKHEIHVMFANNDMYNLENLNLSVPLPAKFNLIVLPIKLVGGSGGPVRVVAFA